MASHARARRCPCVPARIADPMFHCGTCAAWMEAVGGTRTATRPRRHAPGARRRFGNGTAIVHLVGSRPGLARRLDDGRHQSHARRGRQAGVLDAVVRGGPARLFRAPGDERRGHARADRKVSVVSLFGPLLALRDDTSDDFRPSAHSSERVRFWTIDLPAPAKDGFDRSDQFGAAIGADERGRIRSLDQIAPARAIADALARDKVVLGDLPHAPRDLDELLTSWRDQAGNAVGPASGGGTHCHHVPEDVLTSFAIVGGTGTGIAVSPSRGHYSPPPPPSPSARSCSTGACCRRCPGGDASSGLVARATPPTRSPSGDGAVASTRA